MDDRSLPARVRQLLWQRKYLSVLGIVIAVAGGGPDAGLSRLALDAIRLLGWLAGDSSLSGLSSGITQPLSAVPPQELPPIPADRLAVLLAVGMGTAGALLCAAVILAIAVAVIARMAAGGLIAGADQAATPASAGLYGVLQTARQRLWRMIIIVSIPPIPITAGAIIAILVAGVYLYAAGTAGDPVAALAVLRSSPGLLIALGAINTALLVVTLFLLVVQIFADRACVLEDTRPLGSFRRGWQVMRSHPVPVAGLLALQLAAGIAITLLFHLPGIPATVLCLLRPVRWIVTGLAIALFSALWTLLWNEWTARDRVELQES